MEVQLAHMTQREARAAEAERAAAAERERVMAELLAVKGVDVMRQEAHAREVADMQARMSVLQAELTRAQEEASREKERRADALESALRDSRSTRAEADKLRGQLEEARAAGAAAMARAEDLGQKLASAQARLRVLEEQAEQREAHVSGALGRGAPARLPRSNSRP
jgi:chromosome segregation ATPase